MAARALKAYRALLRAYPPRYRARFADDMTDVFADRLRDARRRGRLRVAGLWVRTLGDIATHAAAERGRERRAFAPSGGCMSAFAAEFTTAVRALARRPGFTLTAALMLAVGLGFNTALFAVVETVLLRPLSYTQPDRLAMLWTGRNADGTGGVNSYADYADWQAQSHSFEALAIYNISWGTLTGSGDPEEIGGAVVSPEFFRVLRPRFVLGRGIVAGDELIAVDAGRPIVIAASLWQRRFASDPAILGKSITLAGRARQVVGVVAPEFVEPEPFWDRTAEYWSPMTVTDPMKTSHGNHYLRVIGRLKDGVALASAQAELDQIGRQLMARYPTTNRASVVVANLHDELIGDTRPLLWMFFGALVLVLSLVVANIVNLLLARASRRRAELAIRAALGASRARLMGLLVAESVVTGVLGGVIGLALAELGIRLLLAYGTISAPGIEHTRLDGTVFAFAMGLSVITGALCGLLPAWRVGRARFASSVSDMRGSSGLDVSRARTWLVAGEMALALPLLVGAALLTQTLIRELGVNPGFDPARALQFRVSLAGQAYDRMEARATFFQALTEKLAALPGAEASGAVSAMPLGGLNNTGGTITYEREDGSLQQAGVGLRAATGGYFAALGIPLRQGRVFTESASDARTVVINDRAAQLFWGSSNPLGRRVRFGDIADPPDKSPWLTVVGVVGDVHHDMLVRPPNPEVFQPYAANPWGTMTVVTRTAGNPSSLGSGARAAVRELDPRLAVVALGPASDFVDHQLARPRFGVVCATIFGTLGLALAAFGTFAVLSVLVAQRTREIGIRVALGADRARVRRLVLRDSLIPAVAGCVAGGGLALWAARGLSAQLYGVRAGDVPTLLAAIATLLAVAVAASWWPARRAMAIDPVRALRTD